jgi:dihydroxyacetone kinase-like predicted kinase
MRQAIPAVRSVEITRAVRSTKINGMKIKRKQAIGLLDGELVTVGDDTNSVLHDTLAKLDLDNKEIVTIYFGTDTEQTEAEQASIAIREQHPQLQVEVIRGDQPHYHYIVSVE